jgi:diguanylate cyclase (GGDEF)-like protein
MALALRAVRRGDRVTAPAGRARAWWWVPALGAVLAVVGPMLGPAGRQGAYAVAGFGAVAAIVAGVRRYRPARTRPWWLLAAAMGCGAAANTTWGIGFALGMSTSPGFTAVDVVYFGMYPLLTAAFATLPGRPRHASALSGITEAGLVLCTGSILAWVLLFDPYLHDRGTWSGGVSVLAYPVLDLFMVTMAVHLVFTVGRLTRAHVTLLLAAASLAVADTAYFVTMADGGSWSGTGVSAAGWLAAFALVAAAGLRPRLADGAEALISSRRTVALHLLLVVLGPAATAYSLFNAGGEPFDPFDIAVPLVGTAVSAVLLVLRLVQATAAAQRTAAEQAALQASMSHLALHDPLTGLPNRLLLDRRIDDALAAGTPGALLVLDLDGFKEVNDRFGHPVGDALLVTVAGQLRPLLDDGEVLARLGGDEFAILLPDAGPAKAARCGEAVLRTLRRPLPVAGHQLHVTASVGLRHLDPAAGTTGVLGDADLALYAAKAAGKDRVAAYDAALRERRLETARTVERLRTALDRDELDVHYQPIVDLGTGAAVAVEALVRWHPAGQAPIGPHRFIPIAEDSGLIVPLGERVLRRACRDAAAWHASHGISVTVNVSPRQLWETGFAAIVRDALDAARLPATALVLEITEGVFVRAGGQAEQAVAQLRELRREGVRVAIDDFGTGYSSLSYLRDLPIDTVKIDRSFVPDDADRPASGQAALVRAIVDLARGLDLTTVAEGVETPRQAELLRDLGCDRGQGYHWARPAPVAQIDAYLSQPVAA